MNRIEVILIMDRAITEYERAQKHGNKVCMEVAELLIEECQRKLEIKNESETSGEKDGAIYGQGRRRAA